MQETTLVEVSERVFFGLEVVLMLFRTYRKSLTHPTTTNRGIWASTASTSHTRITDSNIGSPSKKTPTFKLHRGNTRNLRCP